MSKFNLDLSKIDWKKVVTVGTMVTAAIIGAIGDYKEKQEIEDLKETVKALRSKSEGS